MRDIKTDLKNKLTISMVDENFPRHCADLPIVQTFSDPWNDRKFSRFAACDFFPFSYALPQLFSNNDQFVRKLDNAFKEIHNETYGC